MWAVMAPDVYGGESCEEVIPRWLAYAEGDMDSGYEENIVLDAKYFPPGTKISVLEPCCPKCSQVSEFCRSDESCDFDWDTWALDQYS